MVFNILIGNSDDHSRNHAVIYGFESQSWQLSPAFDVLPINNSQEHGLGIGEYGREGTINNALSQAKRFGLQAYKAQKIVDQVRELVSEWPSYMQRSGVQPGDIERLKAVIPEH
jgi:serine/threonine-protein kinase HipA